MDWLEDPSQVPFFYLLKSLRELFTGKFTPIPRTDKTTPLLSELDRVNSIKWNLRRQLNNITCYLLLARSAAGEATVRELSNIRRIELERSILQLKIKSVSIQSEKLVNEIGERAREMCIDRIEEINSINQANRILMVVFGALLAIIVFLDDDPVAFVPLMAILTMASAVPEYLIRNIRILILDLWYLNRY